MLYRVIGRCYNGTMLDRLIKFFRDEAVLCIAFICALVSIAVTGDYSSIPEHIDWRVIALLFCLMSSVAGLSSSGVMARLAQMLVAGEKTRRSVCLALVMLPFFASMLVTNDVALLTFVPIAVLALETAGWQDSLARVVVLQAIAANLGGMVTPVGNPQNLFIFTTYGLTGQDFIFALAPFGLLSLIMLASVCLTFGKSTSHVTLKIDARAIDFKRFAMHVVLFALSVLSVFRIIPSELLVLVIAVALFVFDRRIFPKVDYALLATFACFFIFSGNMANMSSMQEMLGSLMRDHPMLTSLVTSQIISNVPASVLLSGFTSNWHSLLIGVDLGGLGTPIASLASLIALKIYSHTEGARIIEFLKEFAIANLVTLAFMVVLYGVLFVW